MENRRSKKNIVNVRLRVGNPNNIKGYYSAYHIVVICLLRHEIAERVHTKRAVSVFALNPFNRLKNMRMMSYYGVNTAVGKQLSNSFLLGIRRKSAFISPVNRNKHNVSILFCVCGLTYNVLIVDVGNYNVGRG